MLPPKALLLALLVPGVVANIMDMFDLKYWRCNLKKTKSCPDRDIKFNLYTYETGPLRIRVDIRKNPTHMMRLGWNPHRKNVIIIHGFNGTESKTPMTLIRNAYISRGDYNVFTVDWEDLTIFPCYLSALSNTRLVAQCSAKLYAYITKAGAYAEDMVCVGHSLGAHICGMMSSHLHMPQHKIVGLDPARPLINQYGSKYFRLTKDDAHIVQVVHSNAGFLGEVNQVGTVDFCINGGKLQPGCHGTELRKARCSHFQSACYYAYSIQHDNTFVSQPCISACPHRPPTRFISGTPIPMGVNMPENSTGMYCFNLDHDNDCRFD